MEIIGRNKRTKQPQYATPLAADIARAVAFATVPGQTWNHDLKTLVRPSIIGTGLSSRPTVKGLATVSADDTSGLRWSGLTPIANGNNGYAMLLFAAPVSQAEADRAIVLGNEASSAFNQMTFAFNSDKDAATTAGKFALFEYNSAFANRVDSTASQVDGNWHVFIVNRDPGAAGQTRLYRDGVDVTGTQTHAAGVACTAGTSILCSPGSASAGFEHPAAFAVVFNRPLSVSELGKYSQNPWSIFAPRDNAIYVDVIASGAGVGSGDGVATISAVGASISSQAASGTGVATASAVGASVNRQAASGDGVATFTAIGASIAASSASGTGVATASAVGSSAVGGQGVGAGDGVATFSAIGASIVAAVGTGYGVATSIAVSLEAASTGGHFIPQYVTRKQKKLDDLREQLIEALYPVAPEVAEEVKQAEPKEIKRAVKLAPNNIQMQVATIMAKITRLEAELRHYQDKEDDERMFDLWLLEVA